MLHHYSRKVFVHVGLHTAALSSISNFPIFYNISNEYLSYIPPLFLLSVFVRACGLFLCTRMCDTAATHDFPHRGIMKDILTCTFALHKVKMLTLSTAIWT